MKHRDRSPSNIRNWELRCADCGELFKDAETVSVAVEHFATRHGTGKVRLDLKWVGLGPAPKRAPASLFN